MILKIQKILQSSIPYRLSLSGFKYLGIQLTRTLNPLIGANLTPLVTRMKDDFQRWNNLPLLLAGRLQCVKMNILPKFLYFFQCLPVFLPKSFFCTVDQAISAFLWGGKTPRISRNILQRSRQASGLALPSLMQYYWSVNVQKLIFWLKPPASDWCSLEAQSCRSSSLAALIYSSLPYSPSRYTSNPIVLSTLKIWIQFRRNHKFHSASLWGPVGRNHLFVPSTQDSSFAQWSRLGINCLKDLYVDGIFTSFDTLS